MTGRSFAGLEFPGKVDTEIRAMRGSNEVVHGKATNASPADVHPAVQEGRGAPGERRREVSERGRDQPRHRAQFAAALEGAARHHATRGVPGSGPTGPAGATHSGPGDQAPRGDPGA